MTGPLPELETAVRQARRAVVVECGPTGLEGHGHWWALCLIEQVAHARRLAALRWRVGWRPHRP